VNETARERSARRASGCNPTGRVTGLLVELESVPPSDAAHRRRVGQRASHSVQWRSQTCLDLGFVESHDTLPSSHSPGGRLIIRRPSIQARPAPLVFPQVRSLRSTTVASLSSGWPNSRAGGCGPPTRAQQLKTDQQMSFRNLWSSSMSPRIAFGSWSRCHWHSNRPAASLSPSGAAARAALIA
jgi:hypothetical protein